MKISIGINNVTQSPLSTSVGVIGGFLLPIAIDNFSVPIIAGALVIAVIGMLIGTKKPEQVKESPKDYVQKIK